MQLHAVNAQDDHEGVACVLDALASTFPLGERRPDALLKRQWAEGLEALWLAKGPDGGWMALAVVAKLPGTEAFLLDYLAVAPQHQGQGLGTAFLRALGQELHATGAQRLYVECEDPSAAPEERSRVKRLAFFEAAVGAQLLEGEAHALPPLGGGELYPMVLLSAGLNGPATPPPGEVLALKRFIFEQLYGMPLPIALGGDPKASEG